MKSALRFFVYSNLFIAFCSVLMVNQTFRFLLNTAPDNHYLGFVFFSTITSYSFHWYLTSHSVIPSPRVQWTEKFRFFHVILFFIGLAGSAWFLYFLWQWWFWLLVAALMTFLYSAPKVPNRWLRALRKVALGKTIFLAFVWTYVTVILPVIISGLGWQTSYILFIIGRFFLIYAICILFDYRDRADDRASGVRSLITYLPEKGITILFTSSILITFATTLALLNYGFRVLPVIILLIPGIITASLYNYARKHFPDLFFYLILDGLMALSAILMLVPGI